VSSLQLKRKLRDLVPSWPKGLASEGAESKSTERCSVFKEIAWRLHVYHLLFITSRQGVRNHQRAHPEVLRLWSEPYSDDNNCESTAMWR
jgi:hypothetical protein